MRNDHGIEETRLAQQHAGPDISLVPRAIYLPTMCAKSFSFSRQ